ncbi:hypothetical protein J2X16_002997 [Pelomonas aquatica]|uniref:DUF3619 domain-containing protein n=1 Tax=Pelomonas aquatica TaxID=431058 RepID=A0ABU1ZAJ3_9BURK|nr:DUF3619 family protein [Pelomonas aquatica]MDR7297648.1 hypothetical protein [Pelomonas aquatica]
MKSTNFSTPSAELDARVTRFGLRVAAGLTERNAALPHDVSERLRFAREQALARAAKARAASIAVVGSAAPAAVQVGSTLALNGGPRGAGGNGLWAKLGSALPLVLLLAGLLLMQRGQVNEQIAAAAEVDTALLSDNLPPAAFSDPGFAEFLRDGEE